MIFALPMPIASEPLDFLSGAGFIAEGASGTMTTRTFVGHPKVPEHMPASREHRQQIARRVNDTIGRAVNCLIDVTLNANSTTTTITDPRISDRSAVAPLMALSADAAADVAAGIWAFSVTKGSAQIEHRNAPGTGRIICFGIFG